MPKAPTPAPPRLPPKRYVMDVTADDIERAKPKLSNVCAISVAVARAIPDAKSITTDIQNIRFTRRGVRFTYMTPLSVQQYIVDFDGGRPLKPFKFRLDESKLLPVQARRRTAAGKAIQSATNRAGYAAEKRARARGDDPKAARNEARRKAHADARAEHGGPDRESTPGRLPPPVVTRSARRQYGHRGLEINQRYERDLAEAEARGRAAGLAESGDTGAAE